MKKIITVLCEHLPQPSAVSPRREHAAGPYYMSYMWYSTVASTVVVVVGMLVSLATGPQDPRRLDPRLIIPLGNKLKFLPQRWRELLNFNVGVNYVSGEGMGLAETVVANQSYGGGSIIACVADRERWWWSVFVWSKTYPYFSDKALHVS